MDKTIEAKIALIELEQAKQNMLKGVFEELNDNILGNNYEYFISKANDIISFFAVFAHELYYLPEADKQGDTFSKTRESLSYGDTFHIYDEALRSLAEGLPYWDMDVVVRDRVKTLFNVANKVAEVFGIER
jgi:hypothetical protein